MAAPSIHRTPVAEIRVNPMRADDLVFAAALHRRALPGGFFARLGTGFLRRYLATFVTSPHGVALMAWAGQRRVGMLVGTTANRAHWRWAVHHDGPRLAAAGLAALAVRPRQARLFLRTRVGRYWRALRRLRRRPARLDPGSEGARRATAVLTHVAVAEDAHGNGVGRDLVDVFTTAAHASGAAEARLVTAAGSDGAGDFYRRLGWRDLGLCHDRDSEPMRQFTLTLTSR